MRLCRFARNGHVHVGLYDEKFVVSLSEAAHALATASREKLGPFDGENLLDFLPPDGKYFASAKQIADWLERNQANLPANAKLAHTDVELQVPIPRPNKLLLLAGNYNEHLTE